MKVDCLGEGGVASSVFADASQGHIDDLAPGIAIPALDRIKLEPLCGRGHVRLHEVRVDDEIGAQVMLVRIIEGSQSERDEKEIAK